MREVMNLWAGPLARKLVPDIEQKRSTGWLQRAALIHGESWFDVCPSTQNMSLMGKANSKSCVQNKAE
jgi:hypothetical protein